MCDNLFTCSLWIFKISAWEPAVFPVCNAFYQNKAIGRGRWQSSSAQNVLGRFWFVICWNSAYAILNIEQQDNTATTHKNSSIWRIYHTFMKQNIAAKWVRITILTLKERAEPFYLRFYFESRQEVREIVDCWAGHH